MIFDGYHGHVMSGTSLIITTALITVLHCRSAADNCPYIQTVEEWQKYIPKDYRLEIPLSCGDEISCEDIKRALILSHCWNTDCSHTSCNETKKKTMELIRCLPNFSSPNCSESSHREVQIQNQNQKKYILIGEELELIIKGCEGKVNPGNDCPKSTSLPAKTTPTPTTRITPTPTTPSPTSAQETASVDLSPSHECSTQAASTATAKETAGTDPPPSHESSPQAAFSGTSEKSVLVLLMISLCVNVALVLLYLKQRCSQKQLPGGNGYMHGHTSTEDSFL